MRTSSLSATCTDNDLGCLGLDRGPALLPHSAKCFKLLRDSPIHRCGCPGADPKSVTLTNEFSVCLKQRKLRGNRRSCHGESMMKRHSLRKSSVSTWVCRVMTKHLTVIKSGGDRQGDPEQGGNVKRKICIKSLNINRNLPLAVTPLARDSIPTMQVFDRVEGEAKRPTFYGTTPISPPKLRGC